MFLTVAFSDIPPEDASEKDKMEALLSWAEKQGYFGEESEEDVIIEDMDVVHLIHLALEQNDLHFVYTVLRDLLVWAYNNKLYTRTGRCLETPLFRLKSIPNGFSVADQWHQKHMPLCVATHSSWYESFTNA